MIDPMADIDGATSGGGAMDPTTTSDGEHNQEVFDINAHRINMKKMDYIRSFMGIVSGCVAGVLGLTGLSGLGEFSSWDIDSRYVGMGCIESLLGMEQHQKAWNYPVVVVNFSDLFILYHFFGIRCIHPSSFITSFTCHPDFSPPTHRSDVKTQQC